MIDRQNNLTDRTLQMARIIIFIFIILGCSQNKQISNHNLMIVNSLIKVAETQGSIPPLESWPERNSVNYKVMSTLVIKNRGSLLNALNSRPLNLKASEILGQVIKYGDWYIAPIYSHNSELKSETFHQCYLAEIGSKEIHYVISW